VVASFRTLPLWSLLPRTHTQRARAHLHTYTHTHTHTHTHTRTHTHTHTQHIFTCTDPLHAFHYTTHRGLWVMSYSMVLAITGWMYLKFRQLLSVLLLGSLKPSPEHCCWIMHSWCNLVLKLGFSAPTVQGLVSLFEHTRASIHTYKGIRADMHMQTWHTNLQTYLPTHIYTYIQTSPIYPNTYMLTHITYIHTYIHTHSQTWKHAYMHVYINQNTFNLSVYEYMWTNTHSIWVYINKCEQTCAHANTQIIYRQIFINVILHTNVCVCTQCIDKFARM